MPVCVAPPLGHKCQLTLAADNFNRRGGPYQHQYRVGRAPAHRSLRSHANPSGPSTPNSTASDKSGSAPNTWVAPHYSAAHKQDNEKRTKAIEATRQQRLATLNDRETAKLSRHFNQQQAPRFTTAAGTATANPPAVHHEITVSGIRFRVAQNGSKLVKVPGMCRGVDRSAIYPHTLDHTDPSGDINPPNATPKTTHVGGVKFHRTKNGNLYREGVLRAHRYVGPLARELLLTATVRLASRRSTNLADISARPVFLQFRRHG